MFWSILLRDIFFLKGCTPFVVQKNIQRWVAISGMVKQRNLFSFKMSSGVNGLEPIIFRRIRSNHSNREANNVFSLLTLQDFKNLNFLKHKKICTNPGNRKAIIFSPRDLKNWINCLIKSQAGYFRIF